MRLMKNGSAILPPLSFTITELWMEQHNIQSKAEACELCDLRHEALE
jgi:hypothetical protein